MAFEKFLEPIKIADGQISKRMAMFPMNMIYSTNPNPLHRCEKFVQLIMSVCSPIMMTESYDWEE